MDRRLKAEVPDLDIAEFIEGEELDDGQPTPRPQDRLAPTVPVSGARRGAPAENNSLGKSQRKVVITAVDRQTMRSMKLDPTNREHLRAFAEEKRRNPESEAG